MNYKIISVYIVSLIALTSIGVFSDFGKQSVQLESQRTEGPNIYNPNIRNPWKHQYYNLNNSYGNTGLEDDEVPETLDKLERYFENEIQGDLKNKNIDTLFINYFQNKLTDTSEIVINTKKYLSKIDNLIYLHFRENQIQYPTGFDTINGNYYVINLEQNKISGKNWEFLKQFEKAQLNNLSILLGGNQIEDLQPLYLLKQLKLEFITLKLDNQDGKCYDFYDQFAKEFPHTHVTIYCEKIE